MRHHLKVGAIDMSRSLSCTDEFIYRDGAGNEVRGISLLHVYRNDALTGDLLRELRQIRLNGLHELAKEHFDLVMTDIRMPGLTGLDILPIIKRLQPEASVIVITAFGNEEVYRRSFEKGAAGYLEKPIHTDKLRTLVHEMVSPKERMAGG